MKGNVLIASTERKILINICIRSFDRKRKIVLAKAA